MPTTLSAENFVLGSHAYFARDGSTITLPSPGTSGPGVIPANGDASWVEIGTLKNVRATPARGDAQEIWAPSPGGLRLKNVIRPKRHLKFNLTSQDVSPLVIELLFGTGPLTEASATFTPLAQGGALKGWLRFDWYDQTDSKRITVHVYVELIVADDTDLDAEKVVEVHFEAQTLLSGVAYTGTLAAAS